MDKKKKVLMFAGLMALIVIVSGCVGQTPGSLLPGASVFNGCTWQPTYNYVTCQEVNSGDYSTSSDVACPTGADISRCYILSGSAIAGERAWYGSCPAGMTLSTGNYFEQGIKLCLVNPPLSYRVLKKELRECGLAACSQSGIPVPGAQGCSWKPSGSTLLDAFNQPVDTVPVGQSYKYASGQSLVSCPSTCSDMECAIPSNAVKSGTTNYGLKQVRWYAFGTQIYVIGCKDTTMQNQCKKWDNSFTNCLDYGSVQGSECGTLEIRSAGSCTANSDCGDTTRYECIWDNSKLQGACQPKGIIPQTCRTNYDCTQTAPTCNSRQYGGQKCILGTCQVFSEQVQCCSSSDCAPNYFCNAQHQCEVSQSQKPDCPVGKCCEGDTRYKDRTCTDMTGGTKNVCCGDGSCAVTADKCSVPPPGKDWFRVLIGAFVLAVIVTFILLLLSFFVKPLSVIRRFSFALIAVIFLTFIIFSLGYGLIGATMVGI